MKRYALMSILWPSFLAAGVASAITFSLVDPLDIALFGHHMPNDRDTVYAGGFFLFWAMAALSSALTVYLSPLETTDRLRQNQMRLP